MISRVIDFLGWYKSSRVGSAAGSGNRWRGGARLCAASLPQRNKVDWLQQNRGKASVAGHVRQDVACEREQDTRALDQQDRLDGVLRQAAQREHAGIGQLSNENGWSRRRLAIALVRAVMGLRADDNRHLERALALMHTARLYVQVDGDLRLAAQRAEDGGRTRHLKRQVLYVLDVHHQRRGRL